MNGFSMAAGAGLNWFDFLRLIGSIISIASVLGLLINLALRIKNSSPKVTVREFALLVRQPWHIIVALVVLLSTAYLMVLPPDDFPHSLLILIPVSSGFFLMMSFFLAQSRHTPGTGIINEMHRLARQAEEKKRRVRKRGLEVSVVEIPGEDEALVIVVGLSVDEAADVADEIRRRVRNQIQQIPYYQGAVNFIVEGLRPPPSLTEERLGIETVSAGVVAYRGSEEAFLSDVSPETH